MCRCRYCCCLVTASPTGRNSHCRPIHLHLCASLTFHRLHLNLCFNLYLCSSLIFLSASYPLSNFHRPFSNFYPPTCCYLGFDDDVNDHFIDLTLLRRGESLRQKPLLRLELLKATPILTSTSTETRFTDILVRKPSSSSDSESKTSINGARSCSVGINLLCATPPEDAKKFKLGYLRSFRLDPTNCYEVANIDDGREELETRSRVDVVGIDKDEQVDYVSRVCDQSKIYQLW
ncbi:unnamed protein product [Lactuca virosa]|uniref:Uncharacterized protein n=1 Tax=Lactuca virosa TaxID=75947 RepID=A0AAU9P658_9ASTR|nr:unnamed protein product [Lactuca virosa]